MTHLVIIDMDKTYEIVEKETHEWIPVQSLRNKSKIFLEIERLKIPDEMLQTKSLAKELMKNTLHEIINKHKLWTEVE